MHNRKGEILENDGSTGRNGGVVVEGEETHSSQ